MPDPRFLPGGIGVGISGRYTPIERYTVQRYTPRKVLSLAPEYTPLLLTPSGGH